MRSIDDSVNDPLGVDSRIGQLIERSSAEMALGRVAAQVLDLILRELDALDEDLAGLAVVNGVCAHYRFSEGCSSQALCPLTPPSIAHSGRKKSRI